jgi:transcriptional antiterminator RfaH
MSPPPLESFVRPRNLLVGEKPQTPDTANRWWVLHAWPHCERTLARRLLRDNASFFVPVFQQLRHRGLLGLSAPLFPGYLFLWGGREACRSAATTDLVANVLPVADQQQLDADLKRVYALMLSGAPLLPEDRPERGRSAEIVAGPLAGLDGKVLRRGRRFRFAVEVRLLQQGVSVEIERGTFRSLLTARGGEPAQRGR